MKAKKAKKSDDDEIAGGVSIDMSQHVALTFSLKYLVNFAKSSSLSDTVQLMMSNDVPLLVSYASTPLMDLFNNFFCRFPMTLDLDTYITTLHQKSVTTKPFASLFPIHRAMVSNKPKPVYTDGGPSSTFYVSCLSCIHFFVCYSSCLSLINLFSNNSAYQSTYECTKRNSTG